MILYEYRLLAILMKYISYLILFRKLGKMSQYMVFVAAVIDAFRVKYIEGLHYFIFSLHPHLKMV